MSHLLKCGRTCGRPDGHRGKCRSEAAWRSQIWKWNHSAGGRAARARWDAHNPVNKALRDIRSKAKRRKGAAT